jgi:tripartite-type tricarboxylate transporter receptor subunit TctC
MSAAFPRAIRAWPSPTTSAQVPAWTCRPQGSAIHIISNSTRGIAVQKGTPKEVIVVLEAALKKAMANPDHISKMDDAGLALKSMVGEEYAKYYADLHKQAAKYTEWALKMR